jgi:hypothetical protein
MKTTSFQNVRLSNSHQGKIATTKISALGQNGINDFPCTQPNWSLPKSICIYPGKNFFRTFQSLKHLNLPVT